MKNKVTKNRPTVTEIQDELDRMKYRRKRIINIRNVLLLSLLLSAALIIATNLWFPILRVVGSGMQPLLKDGDVVLCMNVQEDFERDDVIVFYHSDKILIRRVIGVPGDRIEIDATGVVTVNGETKLEDYADVLSLEPCDIAFPVTVPEDSYFVLSDQRTTSVDSRSQTIGMVQPEQIIGKALFRIWPVDTFKNLW